LPPTSLAHDPSDFDNSRYEAFRPIIPQHVADSPATPTNLMPETTTVLETSATIENPKNESEMNELKERIAHLEQEVKKSKETPPPTTPPPTPAEETKTNSPQPSDLPSDSVNVVDSLSLPAFNIEGVTTTKDEKNAIRITIVDSLLFVSTSWKLTPDAEELLRRITTEIRAAYPDAEIEIEGHTDNLNVDPKNPTQKHEIATNKTSVVMDYCVKTLKCNPTKIKTIAFGSKHPIADNSTAEGRAKNNRIEIVIPSSK
jgi:flagellar motor protein MotB